jgi:pimeloyl-ACP methyl ester carboxylesterase
MTTFGLIHGGFHTSACWALLEQELRSRGHDVLTVDLPVSDPTADPERYVAAAEAAFSSATEPVVVVGHSIAGWTARQLADRIPVAGVVYLCACINFTPGLYPDEPLPMIAADPADWTPNEEGVITMTREAALQYFYHDVSAPTAEHAVTQLVPQAVTGISGPAGAFERADTPSVYIQATDDRAVSEGWARWAALLLTGSQAVTIGGSHSPMLSRPAELADLLETEAGRFAQ